MHDNRRMPSKVSAFVIWALIAASIMYWGLQLLASSPKAPLNAVPASESSALRGDLARLFGAASVAVAAAPAAVAAPSRFKLIGVAAPKGKEPQAGGVALIAVDGKPARPYRVGAKVDGELTLRALDWRTASLGAADGTGGMVLEVPPRPVASTGTLPPPPPLNSDTAPLPAANTTPAPAAANASPSTPLGNRPPPATPISEAATQTR